MSPYSNDDSLQGFGISGFEVTFEPYPSSEFSGWPAETHLFGNTYLNGTYVQEMSFSQDLE